jgi:glycosyltransferase involved in cell wall biosynthesis
MCDKNVASIIIPAHNEGKFIRRLIQSIRQYGPPGAEIIVVDNGSVDQTAQLAGEEGATVIRSSTRVFPAVARNIGAERSDPRRDILIFLDADVELTEEWHAEWSARAPSLRTDPMQVTGAICEVSRHPTWIERRWFSPMRTRNRAHVDGANIIIARALFDLLQGFDACLETGEDVDLCARANKLGARVVLNNGFKVHHEGGPKTIGSFVRRERWHGTGDFVTMRRVIRSPVALASAAFAVFHVCAVIAVLHLLIVGRGWSAVAVCAVGIIGLCLAGVARIFPKSTLATRLAAIPLMYLYYYGRSLSMMDAVRRLLVGPGSTRMASVRNHR